MPMIGRRRPIARAAMVGGTAYVAGKHAAANNAEDAATQARLAELEAQQAAPPPAAAPAAGGLTEEKIQQLKEIAALHDSGVLTDAEFEVQKQKLLNG
jgi:hypothetical protein